MGVPVRLSLAGGLALAREPLLAVLQDSLQQLEAVPQLPLPSALSSQLGQLRGVLEVLALEGAERLVRELLGLAVSPSQPEALRTMAEGLRTLAAYLESPDPRYPAAPELLLPAINRLRQVASQPELPDSLFFRVSPVVCWQPPLPATGVPADLGGELRRWRRIYQAGLLGFVRNVALERSLACMVRAMGQLASLTAGLQRGPLLSVAAAALAVLQAGAWPASQAQRRCLARLERELGRLLMQRDYQAPEPLLGELLFWIALAGQSGPVAGQIREAFAIEPRPFSGQALLRERRRLQSGGLPDSPARLGERLQPLLESLVSRALAADSRQQLLDLLEALSGSLELPLRDSLLTEQAMVMQWAVGAIPPAGQLDRLAEWLLRTVWPDSPSGSQARQQLLAEARPGLVQVREWLAGTLDSGDNTACPAPLLDGLQAIRAALGLACLEPAAALVAQCLERLRAGLPEGQALSSLILMLSGLEYFMEYQSCFERDVPLLDWLSAQAGGAG